MLALTTPRALRSLMQWQVKLGQYEDPAVGNTVRYRRDSGGSFGRGYEKSLKLGLDPPS